MPLDPPLWQVALDSFAPKQAGAFYGRADELAPGAGVVYSGVTFAEFNAETGRFSARRGPVLILTHECDIDPANDRVMNDYFAFVPLISIDAIEAEFERRGAISQAPTFISAIAKNKINRLFYLPPPDNLLRVKGLDRGAVIFWNQVGNTHISQLNVDDVRPMCALSEYGLGYADMHFRQHFLRPKSDTLARVR